MTVSVDREHFPLHFWFTTAMIFVKLPSVSGCNHLWNKTKKYNHFEDRREGCILYLVSCWDNTHTHNCEKQEIYLPSISRSQSIIEESQEFKWELETETMEELCMLACSHSGYVSFLSQPQTTIFLNDATHSGLGPPASIHNQDNVPCTYLQANLI